VSGGGKGSTGGGGKNIGGGRKKTTGPGKTKGGNKRKRPTRGGGKNNKPPKKRRITRKKMPPKQKETMWTKFRDKIKGMTRGKIFKYLLLAGGLYLVYKWWFDEGASLFPPCLSNNIPEEDMQIMAEQGLEAIRITDTGNEQIDMQGGGLFYDDGEFATLNGRFQGEWSQADDGSIIVEIEGKEYPLSCEGATDEEDDDGGGGGGGGEGGGSEEEEESKEEFRTCNNYPLEKGCSSSKISDIQGCFNMKVTGNFDDELVSELGRKRIFLNNRPSNLR